MSYTNSLKNTAHQNLTQDDTESLNNPVSILKKSLIQHQKPSHNNFELSDNVGRNIKWHSHFGRKSGISYKTKYIPLWLSDAIHSYVCKGNGNIY